MSRPQHTDESLSAFLPESANLTSKQVNALPTSLALRIVVLISLSTLIQEALFCVLTWKAGLSAAIAVQGGWVFVSLMVMCLLTISGVPLPVPRGNARLRTLFTLLVGCGMLFGAVSAIAGGYQFAHYAHLRVDHPNMDLSVAPDRLSAPGEKRLRSLDYIRFTPDFRVIRAAAKRASYDHSFLCAAPIVGARENGVAYFYAVSNDNHCCSFDSFSCFGWDGSVATAAVVSGVDRAVYEDVVDEVALTLKALQLPKVIVTFVALDPTQGADAYLFRALVITAAGFLVWPLPALFAYLWFGQNKRRKLQSGY